MSRWRDPLLQVGANDLDLTKWRSTIFKSSDWCHVLSLPCSKYDIQCADNKRKISYFGSHLEFFQMLKSACAYLLSILCSTFKRYIWHLNLKIYVNCYCSNSVLFVCVQNWNLQLIIYTGYYYSWFGVNIYYFRTASACYFNIKSW